MPLLWNERKLSWAWNKKYIRIMPLTVRIFKYSIAVLLFFFGCTDDPISSNPQLNETIPVASELPEPSLTKTLPASWDENWFSSPVVFDLDGDGGNEIIASRHSVLYVWDTTGILKWRAPVGEDATTNNDHGSSRMYCSPVVFDLDGDGFGEVAVSYSNNVAVYNHNGMLESGWPVSFPGSNGEIRSLAASDLDGNETYEILAVKTSDAPVTCVWQIDGSVRAGWPQADPDTPGQYNYGGYNQNIGSTDLDGDGFHDVISTYDICYIGLFHPDGTSFTAHSKFKGEYVSGVPMFHDIQLAIQGWGPDMNDRDEFTDSPPVFADLDKDGLNEVILFSDHERAGEYQIRGNSLWALNADMTRVPGFEQPFTTGEPLFTTYENNIVQVAPSPCLVTTDDGGVLIIVPSYDGHMYCFSDSGAMLWKVQFDTPGGAFIGASEAVAGDLNNNGLPEIVFTTYSTQNDVSHLFLLNDDGLLLHRVPISGRGSMSAPTLADVEGDGSLEIIISLKDVIGGGDGGVQIWKTGAPAFGKLSWPTGRGNYLRTGEYN